MPAVLLIRKRSDLLSAVTEVNTLLEIRRRHGVPCEVDEVRAICFGSEFSAGQTWWPANCDGYDGPGFCVWASASLGGIWALCWTEGPRLSQAAGSPQSIRCQFDNARGIVLPDPAAATSSGEYFCGENE